MAQIASLEAYSFENGPARSVYGPAEKEALKVN